jgi:DNA-binding transcriptional ArsR family regulator
MADEKLSRDRVFDILSSPRRRYVLYYLREHGGPVKLTDLAEELAAWEHDTTVDELGPQARKRVYVSLYQTHVPKLEDAGLIQYDSDSGELLLAEESSAVNQYLGEDDDGRPWYWYYLTLTAGSLIALFAVLSDVVQVQLTVVFALVIGAFLVLAAVHAAIGRQDSTKSTEFEDY